MGREETPQGSYLEDTVQTVMQQTTRSKLLPVGVCLLVMLATGVAQSDQFRTNDPLKSFVNQEYALGDDYFIHGNRDTYLFRCILSEKTDALDGIALSEISIWGNHGGPWEIFRKTEMGDYVYTSTQAVANTSCLEWCPSKEYLSPANANGSVGGRNNSSIRCTETLGWFYR